MRGFWISVAVIVAALVPARAALANDSSAVIAAGGLVLTKSADIRMAAEDLYLSQDAVRVRYEFVNDTDHDIDTVVAFPLPLIPPRYRHFDMWLQENTEYDEHPIEHIAFGASQDGFPIATTFETRPIFNGHDVSSVLQSAGVHADTGVFRYPSFVNLKPAQVQSLEDHKLIVADGGRYEIRWALQVTYLWTQHFPAGKTVVIEHHYRPVAGGSPIGTHDLRPGTPLQKRYCIGPAAAASFHPERSNDLELSAGYLSYVLLTANNWKAPIGRFHLVLDKFNPNEIVSLCWPDSELRKTGPARFETEILNYRPTHDIEAIFLN